MKKFNKVLSAVLAATMIMASLVGCGDTTPSTDANKTTDNDTTADAGTTGDAVFKIGVIGPTTGDAAAYGQAVVNGAQIAVDEINEAGGINGYMIEYSYEDDECDAEKSVNAYNTLKDWGMQICVGATTSGCSIAVSAETLNDNMFQLTPSGSAVECTTNDNAFRVCFSDPNQGIASADYIADNELATNIAVIYDSSSVYSSGIFEKFYAEAETKGLTVTYSTFTGESNKDFSVQLQAAKDAGAELVFLPIYYAEASLILSQAASMDFDPMWFGCDGLDGLLGVENFDLALAEDVMLLTPFSADATDDLTTSFVAKYEAAYGETPNQFAADAYDAIYAIKAAAEAANANPSMSISDICEALKGAMTTVSVNGLTGEGMTWSADGEPNKAPKAVKITNGVYTLM